jgi:hypothetical protein
VYLGIALFLVIGIFVVFKGYQIYRSAEDSAVESCILSIRQSLADTLKKEEVRKVISPSQEWRVLNKNEQDFLFNSIDNPKNLDCGRFAYFTAGKTQSGKDLHVSVRQISGKIDVIIEGLE